MKKVSVILPIYNVEKYLDRCLKSILSQTMPMEDTEILLVDDGSTDASPSMCDKYAAEHDHIAVIHQRNAGAAGARNAGLTAANGEYVAFIDPDDYIEPHYLETAYKEAIRTGADIVVFDAYREVASAGCVNDAAEGNNMKAELWNHAPCMFTTCDSGDISSMRCQILYPYMRAHTGNIRFKRDIPLSAPWDKLYKREFLVRNGLRFPEELRVLDDMCFNFMAFGKARKISYLPTALYHYCIQSGTITSSYKANRAELDMKVFEFLEREIGGGRNLVQAYYARVIKSFAICCNLSFFNKKNPLGKRQQLAMAKEYMAKSPYNDAFRHIKLRNLEWKLKLVTIAGRLQNPRMLKVLHALQNLNK